MSDPADGGALRSPLDLMMDTLKAVGDDLGGYLLTGVGLALVLMPLVVLAVVGAYLGMGAGFVLGLAADDETVAALGGLLGFLVALMGSLFVTTVVTWPMNASAARALDAHQQAGDKLGIGAPFGTVTTDLGAVLGVSLLVVAATATAALFCYIPGLLVGLFLQFSLTGVAIGGLRPVAAMEQSFRHATTHFSWHLGVFFVTLGITLVLSQIPVVGLVAALPIGLDYQVRAYRAAFG